MKTIEIGYRGVIKGKLFIDADFYYNEYTNFIADVRIVAPLDGAIAGEGYERLVRRWRPVQALESAF